MKQVTYYFLFILLLCSCRQEKQVSSNGFPIDRVISIDLKSKQKISEVITSIDYLVLEDSDEAFLKGINNVRIHNGKIYIHDFRQAKIVAFDMQGNFLFAINNKGEGPREYLFLNSFSVDNEHIYAIVYNGKEALYTYNANTGEYIAGTVIPFMPLGIEVLNNGDFIFSLSPPYAPSKYGAGMPAPEEEYRYRLLVTDKDLTIKKRLFGYDEDTRRYFADGPVGLVSNGNNLYFHYGSPDNLMPVLDKENLDNISYTLIDLNRKPIPEEHKNDIDAIESNEYTRLSGSAIICGQYMMVTVAEKYGTTYFYDLKNNQTLVNPGNNESGWIVASPLCSHNNQLISYFYNEEQYDALMENGYPKGNDEMREHIREGAMVLIFYTLKEI